MQKLRKLRRGTVRWRRYWRA